MPIYKTKEFKRWARGETLDDAMLCNAVKEMQEGLFEANLGSGLFKKRIARPGRGKSAGYRTFIASNRGDLWFFLFGFAKSDRSNIDEDEEAALKLLASTLLSMSSENLQKAEKNGTLIEVNCEEEKVVDP